MALRSPPLDADDDGLLDYIGEVESYVFRDSVPLAIRLDWIDATFPAVMDAFAARGAHRVFKTPFRRVMDLLATSGRHASVATLRQRRIGAFRATPALNSRVPKELVYFGLACLNAEADTDALHAFEEALQTLACGPTSSLVVDAWYGLARALVTTSRYEEATHVVHDLLSLAPQLDPSLTASLARVERLRGNLYFHARRFADAAAVFALHAATEPSAALNHAIALCHGSAPGSADWLAALRALSEFVSTGSETLSLRALTVLANEYARKPDLAPTMEPLASTAAELYVSRHLDLLDEPQHGVVLAGLSMFDIARLTFFCRCAIAANTAFAPRVAALAERLRATAQLAPVAALLFETVPNGQLDAATVWLNECKPAWRLRALELAAPLVAVDPQAGVIVAAIAAQRALLARDLCAQLEHAAATFYGALVKPLFDAHGERWSAVLSVPDEIAAAAAALARSLTGLLDQITGTYYPGDVESPLRARVRLGDKLRPPLAKPKGFTAANLRAHLHAEGALAAVTPMSMIDCDFKPGSDSEHMICVPRATASIAVQVQWMTLQELCRKKPTGQTKIDGLTTEQIEVGAVLVDLFRCGWIVRVPTTDMTHFGFEGDSFAPADSQPLLVDVAGVPVAVLREFFTTHSLASSSSATNFVDRICESLDCTAITRASAGAALEPWSVSVVWIGNVSKHLVLTHVCSGLDSGDDGRNTAACGDLVARGDRLLVDVIHRGVLMPWALAAPLQSRGVPLPAAITLSERVLGLLWAVGVPNAVAVPARVGAAGALTDLGLNIQQTVLAAAKAMRSTPSVEPKAGDQAMVALRAAIAQLFDECSHDCAFIAHRDFVLEWACRATVRSALQPLHARLDPDDRVDLLTLVPRALVETELLARDLRAMAAPQHPTRRDRELQEAFLALEGPVGPASALAENEPLLLRVASSAVEVGANSLDLSTSQSIAALAVGLHDDALRNEFEHACRLVAVVEAQSSVARLQPLGVERLQSLVAEAAAQIRLVAEHALLRAVEIKRRERVLAHAKGDTRWDVKLEECANEAEAHELLRLADCAVSDPAFLVVTPQRFCELLFPIEAADATHPVAWSLEAQVINAMVQLSNTTKHEGLLGSVVDDGQGGWDLGYSYAFSDPSKMLAARLVWVLVDWGCSPAEAGSRAQELFKWLVDTARERLCAKAQADVLAQFSPTQQSDVRTVNAATLHVTGTVDAEALRKQLATALGLNPKKKEIKALADAVVEARRKLTVELVFATMALEQWPPANALAFLAAQPHADRLRTRVLTLLRTTLGRNYHELDPEPAVRAPLCLCLRVALLRVKDFAAEATNGAETRVFGGSVPVAGAGRSERCFRYAVRAEAEDKARAVQRETALRHLLAEATVLPLPRGGGLLRVRGCDARVAEWLIVTVGLQDSVHTP